MTRPHITHRARVRSRSGSDEGSLLMALMFTFMITALTLAIMASVLAGMKKANDSRTFALAQQAADIAIADALMHANMGRFTTAPIVVTNSGKVFPSGTTGGVGVGRPIDWTWTATKDTGSNTDWTIDVEARGKSVDRHFRTTLARTPVLQGTWSDTNGDGVKDNIRYSALNRRWFSTGFYAAMNMTLRDSSGAAPIVDGYNGGRGFVGTGNTINVSISDFDVANLWNWKTTDTVASRCTGTDCTTATFRTFEQPFQLDRVPVCTGGEDWVASSGIPLKHGDCYQSLIFDVDYYFAPADGKQAWIGVHDDVVINPGINVGANRTTTYTKAPQWIIGIDAGGTFNLGANAVFSGGVYNPQGDCNVTGIGATQPTTWLGAAACNNFDAVGRVRLRYDGGMATVERNGDSTTGSGVWSLRNFQIVD